MAGTKISTTIDTSITLGTSGYSGPISITKTGGIEPTQYHATALTVPSGAAHAMVVNHGLIVGGAGYQTGPNYIYGISGGNGLNAGAGAKIVNDGTIIGGSSTGAQYLVFPPYVFNGAGAGADIYGAHALLINNGLVEGGADSSTGGGGTGVSVGGGATVLNNGSVIGGAATGGNAGAGMYVRDGALLNNGTIEAGYSSPGDGFTGATGVLLGGGGKVLNDGLIIGGDGGARAQGAYGYRFGQGGAGVSITSANAVLMNDGKIYGGAGGAGAGYGGDGVVAGAYASISIVNDGLIAGGIAGPGTFSSGYGDRRGVGGEGAAIYDGTLTNRGTILGGAGGGTGVGVSENGLVLNSGTILGGAGGGAGLIATGQDAGVSNSGIILGAVGAAATSSTTNGGGGGIGIIFASDHGIGSNAGTIIGGNGGAATSGLMGAGGDGASIEQGVFTNTGVILGGAGTAHPNGYYLGKKIGGGYGAAVAGGTLINLGSIAAGISGGSDYGAAGVFLSTGNLMNSGVIVGGGSGTAKSRYPANDGVAGGTGVFDGNTRYGSVTNSGTILGGTGANAGSSAASFGAGGGYGVVVQGEGSLAENQTTFDNKGTISGGAGGLGNSSNIYGGEGGVGLKLSYGLVVNTGIISGGDSKGEIGGFGAFIGSYGTFINSGLVSGGNSDFGMFVAQGVSAASIPVIVNTGTIMGGNANSHAASMRAASGGWGLALNQGNFTNSGEIIGGAGGGPQRYDQYAAGLGAYVGGRDAVLTNSAGGSILGGYDLGSGKGASGVYLKFGTSITNAGLIVGGATKYQYNAHIGYGSYAGQGGTGVSLGIETTMSNSGTIIGGAAGVSDANSTGVAGGSGVFLTTYYYGEHYHSNQTSLLNSGTITGGAGGYGTKYGGAGGAGVYLKGGTLTTSGTITGGAGGYGKLGDGKNGDAVELTNFSTLVVEQGAVFNGLVAGSGGAGIYTDLLELSGQSSKPLTGIGTQITGFDSISFATKAAWTISGDTAGLAAGQTIAGFTSSDAITLTDAAAGSGKVSVGKAGIVTISAGGDIYHLDIAGATVGESNLTFANYTLRETGASGAPAMTFLRPAQSAAPAPSSSFLPGPDSIIGPQSWHATALSGTWSGQSTFATTPVTGWFQDVARPLRENIQPVVTLHAG